MNDRTCIVTRQTLEPDLLLRFVAGPDGSVVPDIKRRLPGRGCWVTDSRGNELLDMLGGIAVRRRR